MPHSLVLFLASFWGLPCSIGISPSLIDLPLRKKSCPSLLLPVAPPAWHKSQRETYIAGGCGNALSISPPVLQSQYPLANAHRWSDRSNLPLNSSRSPLLCPAITVVELANIRKSSTGNGIRQHINMGHTFLSRRTSCIWFDCSPYLMSPWNLRTD
ncbi:hypothetical protein GMDG_03395 [Pseudogymnoascus destructans 20631-21]|uniref:Secreted protein n=1 Tax=Pseudogymnoascus destructans (strain ATCC MYA-4855 / 20631-21) TaxID=658429 RepID=L8G7U6_PSED2|nr:hypothetical protein GMDG_03395 [Pseudogymnoascus destructans 20631-21]